MEHTHVAVWPETRSLLQALKGSLSEPGEVIPITMAGVLHAALCRLSEDIERPSERQSVRLQVRQVRMYHRVTSRGDKWRGHVGFSNQEQELIVSGSEDRKTMAKV